jgi:hypothetical protein
VHEDAESSEDGGLGGEHRQKQKRENATRHTTP